MTVWIVNQYAIPPSQPGGTRHFTLARELIRRGHDATIIASSFDHVLRKETRLQPGETWRLEMIESVPFVWLRTPPYPGNTMARVWNMLVFAWRVWRGTGTKQLRRPDAIIGSSPHLFGALAAERRAKKLRVPFALEVRDLWPESLVQIGKVSKKHPLVIALRGVERWLYKKSARIITLLPGSEKYIAAHGGKAENILWLPNGVDMTLAHGAGPAPANQKFSVMYTGTLALMYGMDTLLNVALWLQNNGYDHRVLIRVVGDGPERARLEKRIADEGIRGIQLEGSVPKSQVFARMAEADALVAIMRDLPLFQHGTSLNKVHDYMAVGRPIIFGVRSANNPVEDAKCGITVTPEDVPGTARAIIELLNMPANERVQMGENGRAYVSAHHDFEQLGGKLEQLLLSITTNK